MSLFQFPDFAGFSLRGTGQSYLPRTVLHLMNFNIFSSKNKLNNSLSFLSEHKVSYTRIVRFDWNFVKKQQQYIDIADQIRQSLGWAQHHRPHWLAISSLSAFFSPCFGLLQETFWLSFYIKRWYISMLTLIRYLAAGGTSQNNLFYCRSYNLNQSAGRLELSLYLNLNSGKLFKLTLL